MSELKTSDLRKAATAVFIAIEAPVATDIATKLNNAALEIEMLRLKLGTANKEIEDLKLQANRNLCPHWDSEEGECED